MVTNPESVTVLLAVMLFGELMVRIDGSRIGVLTVLSVVCALVSTLEFVTPVSRVITARAGVCVGMVFDTIASIAVWIGVTVDILTGVWTCAVNSVVTGITVLVDVDASRWSAIIAVLE